MAIEVEVFCHLVPRARRAVAHIAAGGREVEEQPPLPGLQNEASARLADVESIARADMLPEVGPTCCIRLDLHADSIPLTGQGTRERVAAKERRPTDGRLETQYDVLTRQT